MLAVDSTAYSIGDGLFMILSTKFWLMTFDKSCTFCWPRQRLSYTSLEEVSKLEWRDEKVLQLEKQFLDALPRERVSHWPELRRNLNIFPVGCSFRLFVSSYILQRMPLVFHSLRIASRGLLSRDRARKVGRPGHIHVHWFIWSSIDSI